MTKHDNSSLVAISDVPAALGLLSRLPVRVDMDRATARGGRAAWAYPVAGLALALIACAVAQITLMLGLPAPLAAGLALATLVITTGAMHEDGLADTAGYRNRRNADPVSIVRALADPHRAFGSFRLRRPRQIENRRSNGRCLGRDTASHRNHTPAEPDCTRGLARSTPERCIQRIWRIGPHRSRDPTVVKRRHHHIRPIAVCRHHLRARPTIPHTTGNEILPDPVVRHSRNLGVQNQFRPIPFKDPHGFREVRAIDKSNLNPPVFIKISSAHRGQPAKPRTDEWNLAKECGHPIADGFAPPRPRARRPP